LTHAEGRTTCPECHWERAPHASTTPQAPVHDPYLAWKLLGGWALIAAMLVLTALISASELGLYMPGGPLGVLGGAAVYLLISFLWTPSPDTSDLGYFGGLSDNPFSFSDDWNRFLLSVNLLLYPGRIASWTLRVTWRKVRARLKDGEARDLPRPDGP